MWEIKFSVGPAKASCSGLARERVAAALAQSPESQEREGSRGIMCLLGTFCPLQLSETLASSPTAGIRAALGTRLTAGFALVFKIPHILSFTFLRNVSIKAAEHGPFRMLKALAD